VSFGIKTVPRGDATYDDIRRLAAEVSRPLQAGPPE
jgi:hypothetical protein